MITDEQGRGWLLKKLYDAGCRNIHVELGWAIVFIEKNGTVCLPANILGFDKGIGVIDIAEELGIVDWNEVPFDTPILVKGIGLAEWQNRYFAFFKDGEVYAWCNGATSWSCKNSNDVSSWKYAKLAEV